MHECFLVIIIPFNLIFNSFGVQIEGIDENVVIALLLLQEDEEDEATKRNISEKQCRVRPLLQNREYVGAYYTTFQEVGANPQECRGFIRIDDAQFQYLVEN